MRKYSSFAWLIVLVVALFVFSMDAMARPKLINDVQTHTSDVIIKGDSTLAIKSGSGIDVEDGASLKIDGTAVTPSAAELNKLDGIVGPVGDSVAAVTATTGVTTVSAYIGALHHDVITFTSILETATAGSAEGESQLICTFPAGRILILGASINADIEVSATFEASTDDVFYSAIGTAAAGDDDDLTSTEADIIAKTTFDTVSSATTNFTFEADMTSGADSVFDGTTTATALYANFAIADATFTNDTTFALTGYMTVNWTWLGDD